MNVFLRSIPDHLVAMVSQDQASVVGSTIRGLDGRILGHLQGTSVLNTMLRTGVSTSPVDSLLKGVAIVQNEQIKSGLKILTHLQRASLGLNVVGIGVSVVGFAAIARQIGRLDSKLDAQAKRIDHIADNIELLRLEPIRRDLDQLETLAKLWEEGWTLADPVSQWKRVAFDAAELQLAFEKRALTLLENRQMPAVREAAPLIEAFALGCQLRVSARLATGELAAAQIVLGEAAEHLQRLAGHYQLSSLAMQEIGGESARLGTDEWGTRLAAIAHTLSDDIALMREHQIAIASAQENLVELKAQGIDSRHWIEAARREQESPFLFLPATDN